MTKIPKILREHINTPIQITTACWASPTAASTDHVEPWRVPVPGAIKTYGPEVLAMRGDVMALAKEVFR